MPRSSAYSPYLKMYYDLELTLLGQLGFLGPVTTVYMVQIYVPEHLRSHPSQIDENQHILRSDTMPVDYGDSNRAFKRDCTVYTGY